MDGERGLQWFTAYKHSALRIRSSRSTTAGTVRHPPVRSLHAGSRSRRRRRGIRTLGITNVIAVGYSMGGPIAVLLWQRHRILVQGLVLCATASSGAEPEPSDWDGEPFYGQRG